MKKIIPLLILLGASLPRNAFSEDSAQATFENALKEFKQGQLAAGEGHWNIALLHFDNAQKQEPLLPESFFNLGLAYRNSGAPILAVLWLQAYLEAQPDSPDAKTLEQEVNRLKIQAEAKSQELIQLALTSAQQIPEDYEDEKNEALGNIALLEALSGRVEEAVRTAQKAGIRADPSFYLRYYGESLAAAHDYEGVKTALDGIENETQAGNLLLTLARYQILRNEPEAAGLTLRQLPASPERIELLNRLLTLYTRKLDLHSAEPLLKEIKNEQDKRLLQNSLMSGYLKAGLPDEAKKIASELQSLDNPVARAVLGEGKQVLEEIKLRKHDAKTFLKFNSDAYAVTIALAWMNETALAHQGCDLLRQGTTAAAGASSDFSAMACAYVYSEENRFDEALNEIEKISAGSKQDFAVSLFWRLVYQQRYEDIQKLISFLRDPAAKATLIRHFAAGLQALGEKDRAAQLTGEAFNLAVTFNLGFILRDIARQAIRDGDAELERRALKAARVVHWVFLANGFRTKEPVVRLARFFEENKSEDLRLVTSTLIQAAGDWTQAVTYIHSIERRHNQT